MSTNQDTSASVRKVISGNCYLFRFGDEVTDDQVSQHTAHTHENTHVYDWRGEEVLGTPLGVEKEEKRERERLDSTRLASTHTHGRRTRTRTDPTVGRE